MQEIKKTFDHADSSVNQESQQPKIKEFALKKCVFTAENGCYECNFYDDRWCHWHKSWVKPITRELGVTPDK